MMKQKRLLIIGLTLVFLGVNFYLIEKANSKVDRTVYIKNWFETTEKDLAKTLEKEGVIASSEEHHVYFNDEMGAFNGFLVEEGDTVAVGAPLYEYVATDIDEQRRRLESEIEQLQDEIMSIEAYIRELEQLEFTLSSLPSSSPKDDDEAVESNVETEFGLKKDIAAYDLEISRLENQIDNLERQVLDLDMNSASLTVQSDVAGVIKKVSHSVENPLITIVSDSPVVSGKLTEKESFEISPEMRAEIRSEHHDEFMSGIVLEVAEMPKNDPDVDQESVYPFTVTFDVPEVPLLKGYHVDVSIVVEEATGAVTVPSASLVKEGALTYVWLITDSGRLEKREVETGLEVNGVQQITTGVEAGEHYIVNPDELKNAFDTSRFSTPLKWDNLSWTNLKGTDKTTIYKHILYGILER